MFTDSYSNAAAYKNRHTREEFYLLESFSAFRREKQSNTQQKEKQPKQEQPPISPLTSENFSNDIELLEQ